MDGLCGRLEPFLAGRRIRDLRGAAGRLFEFCSSRRVEFSSPRAWAFTLLGIQEYLTSFPGDRDAQKVRFVLGAAIARDV